LYNALGIFYLGIGKYDEAIAMHQRYVALAPEEPNAYDSLGMSYEQSGRYDEATSAYQKALALNPEFEPAIIHLGDVHFQQGRYREAINQFQQYIRTTRSDLARALGYGSIAHVYWSKRDLHRAEQAARKEMSYEKGAVWNLLVIALERGDTASVERLKEDLFAKLPYPQRGARHDRRSLEYYRGYLALKSGKADEAIGHFKEALSHLPPTSGIDLYEDCLANAYLESGQLDEAINEYQRLLNLNPNYPLARYHLGQAYTRKGESERARAEYLGFLETWKNADADLPEVMESKKRYAN
jgi:tetratricopeptide (TPR) repeat protein